MTRSRTLKLWDLERWLPKALHFGGQPEGRDARRVLGMFAGVAVISWVLAIVHVSLGATRFGSIWSVAGLLALAVFPLVRAGIRPRTVTHLGLGAWFAASSISCAMMGDLASGWMALVWLAPAMAYWLAGGGAARIWAAGATFCLLGIYEFYPDMEPAARELITSRYPESQLSAWISFAGALGWMMIQARRQLDVATGQWLATRSALESRDRDRRSILDSLDEVVLVVDAEGYVVGPVSDVARHHFGEHSNSMTLWEYLGRFDAKPAERLKQAWMNWHRLSRDKVRSTRWVMDELPQRMRGQEREYTLHYRPVLRNAALERVIVILTDVSDAMASLAAEEEQRELLEVLNEIGHDPSGISSFLSDVNRVFEQLRTHLDDSVRVGRLLRFLATDFALHRMTRSASMCRKMAARIVHPEHRVSARELDTLMSHWAAMSMRILPLLAAAMEKLEVDREDYEAALKLAEDVGGPLEESLRAWSLERVSRRFERVARHLQSFAAALGQSPPQLNLEDDGVRIPHGDWSDFWLLFTQVGRFCVAQGDDQRRAQISLRGVLTEQSFILEIIEHGDAWCWRELESIAERMDTDRDVLLDAYLQERSKALHADPDFATAFDWSALRSVCARLGGAAQLDPESEGLHFRFSFPVVTGDRPGRLRLVAA